MNLLHLMPAIRIENEILKLQNTLRKVKDDKEKDKLIVEIIKLNGVKNDFAAKIGEMR